MMYDIKCIKLCVTCSAPVSGFARIPVFLPSLLQDVSQRQHHPSTHDIGDQQVAALEERPPVEPYPDQKLFTRTGKHDVQTGENTVIYGGEEKRQTFRVHPGKASG